MTENPMNESLNFDLPKNQSSVIKVIGVGGGGSNAVNHMYRLGIRGVDFVVCNTDAQALENSPVPNKVQLGVSLTEGLGAGANPEIGQQSARESLREISSLLEKNTKMVFITAGMGGGTGTGAAPVIARAAKDMGILTVGIVTVPFTFEGSTRMRQAETGVDQLRASVDSLVVINNNKLREVYGNLGFKAGFAKADEVLATAARGIAEVITHHYTTNIDLRDARTVLADSGTAIMGSGTASGPTRALDAVAGALDSPLLNDNHIRGAKNVLLLIVSGSEEITIDEIGEINDHIQNESGGNTNIIMGIGEDESLGDAISVTVVATGFSQEQQMQVIHKEPQKVVHVLDEDQSVTQSVYEKPLSAPETPARKDQTPEARHEEPQRERIQHRLFEEAEERPAIHPIPEEPRQELKEEPKQPEPAEEPPVAEEEPFTYFTLEDSETIDEVEGASEPVASVTEERENPEEVSFVFHLSEEEIPENEAEVLREEEEIMKFESQRDELRAQAFDQPFEEEKKETPAAKKPEEEVKRYSLEELQELEERLGMKKNPAPAAKAQDEEIHFEYKVKTEEPVNQSSAVPPSPEADPFDQPIAASMQVRAEERKLRLKAFNYRFKNNQDLHSAEEVPAYKRMGVELDQSRHSTESRVSRFTLGSDKNDDELRTNNSFLHDNVD